MTLRELWWGTHEASVDRSRTSLDARPIVLFVLAAAALTLDEYFGHRYFFRELALFPEEWRRGPAWHFFAFGWTCVFRAVVFAGLPAAALLALRGRRLRDHGLSPAGLREHAALVAGAVALTLPLVLFLAKQEVLWMGPSLRVAARTSSGPALWWGLYAAQVVAIELFFRGVLLQATRASLGIHAVVVLAVPYSMMFHKRTLGESLIAIAVAVVWGVVALRARTIWVGVLVQLAATAAAVELWLP
jgi:hypothetical protein